jgi:Sensors of blue-light using FAD
MPDLYQFFYVSQIAGPRAHETVSTVVAQARPLNQARDITGLLVFDGAQVCQYLEGESPELAALWERLAQDGRHERMRVLHHAPLEGPRRFARWRLGYLNLDDGRDLSCFDGLSGPAAVERLLTMFPTIDLHY